MIFSPSVEIMFGHTKLSLDEQIRKVHELGFQAFEFWSWWNKDLDMIRDLTRNTGIRVASMVVKNSSLVDPAHRESFIADLRESLDAAAKLDCPFLIVTTGNERIGVPRYEQVQSVINGLKAAAVHAEKAGVTLVLEPLNPLVDHIGYFLATTEEAAFIVDAVGSDRVKILYDVYHQQITEGNLILNIRKHFDKIGYFHIADHPGRNEPGTGEINYINILNAIKGLGYTGYIGMEYKPTVEAEEALRSFLNDYR